MELLSKLKQEQRKHVYPVSFSCMDGKNEPTKGQSETIRYQVRRNFQRWWKTGEGDKQRIYGFRHYKTYALLWTYYSESYRFVQLKFARKYNFKWEIELLSQNYFNTSSYYISLTPQSTRVFKKKVMYPWMNNSISQCKRIWDPQLHVFYKMKKNELWKTITQH